MILADKIIQLRKKNGWSQEELAEKMNVSRQSVSKWEGAQSTPDLQKLLQLADIFGVTTDYLLKDEMENEEYAEESSFDTSVRKVSLQEASDYIKQRSEAASKIAIATFMCIISPICLIILGAASEIDTYNISENMAGAIGLIVLLLIVAGAVAIYISCGFKNAPYEYLEKESFETEYGVTGVVKEKQKAYRNTYIRANVTGVCLCVISPIPLFLGAFSGKEFLTVVMLAITMVIVGIGVMFFVTAGVKWAGMQRILKEGEYKESGEKLEDKIGGVYWPIITAIYLGWSFLSMDWHITWVVWPVAAVAFAAIVNLWGLIKNK